MADIGATSLRRAATESFARLRGGIQPAAPEPIPAPSNDVGPAPAPAPRPAPGEGPSILAARLRLKGSIAAPGELQIHGVVEGDAQATVLKIGSEGAVQGDVTAETVIVAGVVEGRIFGGRVQLLAGARVSGDIIHQGLAIEAGALFEGVVRRSDTAA